MQPLREQLIDLAYGIATSQQIQQMSQRYPIINNWIDDNQTNAIFYTIRQLKKLFTKQQNDNYDIQSKIIKKQDAALKAKLKRQQKKEEQKKQEQEALRLEQEAIRLEEERIKKEREEQEKLKLKQQRKADKKAKKLEDKLAKKNAKKQTKLLKKQRKQQREPQEKEQNQTKNRKQNKLNKKQLKHLEKQEKKLQSKIEKRDRKYQKKLDKINRFNAIDKENKIKNKIYKKQVEKFNTKRVFQTKIKPIGEINQHVITLEIQQNIEDNYREIVILNNERVLTHLKQIQRERNLPFKVGLFIIVEVSEMINNEPRYSIQPFKIDYLTVNDLDTQLFETLISQEAAIEQRIQSLGASNLQFERYLQINVEALQYQQSSVGSFIETQGLLREKQAIMNIQNQDNQCALYCFMYQYYTKVLNKTFKNFNRPNNYKFKFEDGVLRIESINKDTIKKEFNIGNIKFPTNISDIEKIAKAFNFTFSLFEHQSIKNSDKEQIAVRVVYNQKEQEDKIHIDLLMLKSEEEDIINTHLVVIKSLSRLLEDGNSNKKYHCKNCLTYYYKQEDLKKHEGYCYEQKKQVSTDQYPKEGTQIKFDSYHKQLELPFFITADFESILRKHKEEAQIEQVEEDGMTQNCKTKKLTKHEICSYGFQLHDKHNLIEGKHYFEYVKKDDNDNVIQHFLNEIQDLSNTIMDKIKNTNIPYKNNEELQQQKREATECYLCNEPFTRQNYAVVDHDHFTGKVRGIAHNNCNLHYHLQQAKIPVIFHNLKGYDAHFILKQIGEFMNLQENKGRINCIANNSEKLMSIQWNNVRFIDSYQFMASSLNQLGQNLKIEQKTYTLQYLKERFGDKLSQEDLNDLVNKGHFPYNWFDSLEKLDYEGLPERQAFYNDLCDEELKYEDYQQAKKIFEKLGFKTFREWLLLYQAIDIKLLTDVWQAFKEMSLKVYGLEPGHYYTSPGLSWDSMLKLTKIKIDLVSNPEIYMMFERQSRGGISTTGNVRYAKANNQYCEEYNEQQDYTQIIYLDANNLYGHAMSQNLPYKDIKFINQDQLEQYGTEFIKKYQTSDIGYVYEVDLKYPIELHDKHNAYPLAAEQLNIQHNQLSQYNKNVIQQLKEQDIKISFANNIKLTPNLNDKTRYVCNIENLKQIIEEGLIITKIHRIITFKQKAFMKQYIDLNTSMRQQAKNDFEKDFFKLMNNSVFGKTCENVRNRANYELVQSKKRLQKIINSRYFKNIHRISDNLALVQKHQKVVNLNKPHYIGMQILDLSKITMYNFYYKNFINEFKQVDVIMTDTDSLFMKVTCNKEYDVYDSMIKNSELYDLSNVTKGDLYNKAQKYCEEKGLNLQQFLNKNKAVPGKMKSENPNSEIIEAVSIKSKCYDFITSDNKNHKKLKGVKKYVVKKQITHQDYLNCVKEQKTLHVEQKSLRSYNHEIFTISQEKIALQSMNDKRYVLQDGITCNSYGHYKNGSAGYE